MLKITIPDREYFDEVTETFETINGQTIQLEHSLVSLSKWESKWNKPFLSKTPKTDEELIDYIKCMTLTQNVNPVVYKNLTRENLETINKYINEKKTATTINHQKTTPNREIVTAEIIYYWMIALNIPFECQKWHLDKLLTLIEVCSIKNTPSKKMSKKDTLNRNAKLNKARREAAHSKG